MTIPRHPESGCIGKDKLTKAQADAIVRRASFSGNAYKCQCCGSWHVGHGNRMSQKRAAARRGH
jgi:hypothetical protein